jgi:hypothetical protein
MKKFAIILPLLLVFSFLGCSTKTDIPKIKISHDKKECLMGNKKTIKLLDRSY